MGLDWRVLLFTIGVSLGTGILFGLIRCSGSRAEASVPRSKESAGRSSTGFRQNKARSLLVVIEVALALILLIGSALLIRTAVALGRVDPGFDARNVLTMRMSLTRPRFPEVRGGRADGARRCRAAALDARRRRGERDVLRALRAATACHLSSSAADASGRSFHGGGGWVTISPTAGRLQDSRQARPRLQRARYAATPGVVIINETMARRFWRRAIR